MSLLVNLYNLTEGSDMTELPPDAMKDVQKNIRAGAQDTDENWANALDLIHKAYEVSGVQRPTPSMKKAWSQYEENIQYGVEQLAKFRGIDSDWRMSAAMFNEALTKKVSFRVSSMGGNSADSYEVKAKSIDDIIEAIENKNTDMYDIDIKKADDELSATLYFSKWGVKKNYRLKIEQNINN
jgi:hypothetical protein